MAKVLVWTQAYNAEHTLRRAMDSVLNQTFSDIRYYVMDNGSQDKTHEIIQEYAARDSRVVPLHVDVNNLFSSSEIMPDYLENTEAEWFVWCDADDEYVLDFLENAIAFAEEEKLDMVAGGYEQINALTGEVIKRRALGYNMILSGDDFTDKFIQYRGFTIGGWGKLCSVSNLRQSSFASKKDKFLFYADCNWGLQMFQRAERAGIYKDVAYKYYIYPNSLSKKLDSDMAYFDGYEHHWQTTQDYLEEYGEISELNRDFLYAIYLSLMEERLATVYGSALEYSDKLKYVERVFSKPVAKETFFRKADPQFRNLAARGEFIQGVKDWVALHAQSDAEKRLAQSLLAKLDAIAVNIGSQHI